MRTKRGKKATHSGSTDVPDTQEGESNENQEREEGSTDVPATQEGESNENCDVMCFTYLGAP
jgi:hypothetical protein